MSYSACLKGPVNRLTFLTRPKQARQFVEYTMAITFFKYYSGARRAQPLLQKTVPTPDQSCSYTQWQKFVRGQLGVPLSSPIGFLPCETVPWPCGDAVSDTRPTFSFSCAALCHFVEPSTTERNRIVRTKASEIMRLSCYFTTRRRVFLILHSLLAPLQHVLSPTRLLDMRRWRIADIVSHCWCGQSHDDGLCLTLPMVEKCGEATLKFQPAKTSFNPCAFHIAWIHKILVTACSH